MLSKFYVTALVATCILILECVESAIYGNYLQNNGWLNFQTEHVLNPEQDLDYSRWRGKEWRRWMFKRNPALQKSLRHPPRGKAGILRLRHTEVVIVARPEDVVASFNGNLVQYGTKNQAMVWSNWSFPTFIFQRAGRRLRVYECGEMFIAGRLLNGYPAYLHDFYPLQIRNPLGGSLRYPVSSHCSRIPAT
ncbi:unnamed protein product [Allacma fusca]|uniref:Uncharacterized protein n=1 Tax=Allacma fusca TaxID=39272 RepID=A0A8J2KX68_9HEXA|nr:unnamed protein product [Allacma fusca]